MSTISASTTTTTAYKVTADTTGTLVLQTGATPTTAVTIDSSQNLGLGVTPSAWGVGTNGHALEFSNAGSMWNYSNTTGINLSQNVYYNGAYYYKNTAAATIYGQGSGQHIWYNAPSGTGGTTFTPTQAMTLDASGNWILGTTSQIGTGKTSILFNGATQNAIETQDSGTNSNAAFFSARNSGGTQIGSITRVGTTNAVIYNTSSDQRLKSNVEDAAPILDKLLQVKVRQFDWTEGDLHQDYGFIAQELEPILSGIVTKGKTEKDVWQLDYSRLTPHLLKALQEQQVLITQLQADVAALKGA